MQILLVHTLPEQQGKPIVPQIVVGQAMAVALASAVVKPGIVPKVEKLVAHAKLCWKEVQHPEKLLVMQLPPAALQVPGIVPTKQR